ncbi:MAG TPA: DUF2158 domain-containing protein [Phycisphaerae bacterium]|nr:DUF2158 domain-containing protein [Phycisphaerae bacterium]
MEHEKFEKGDTVDLKSGSPLMTVEGFTDDNRVICVWYEGGEVKRAYVDPPCLRKTERS